MREVRFIRNNETERRREKTWKNDRNGNELIKWKNEKDGKKEG